MTPRRVSGRDHDHSQVGTYPYNVSINEVDECCRLHDIDYDNVHWQIGQSRFELGKNPQAIREADGRFMACMERYAYQYSEQGNAEAIRAQMIVTRLSFEWTVVEDAARERREAGGAEDLSLTEATGDFRAKSLREAFMLVQGRGTRSCSCIGVHCAFCVA